MYEENPFDHVIQNRESVNYQNAVGGSLNYNPPVIDLNQVVENAANKLKNWWEDVKYNSQQDQLTQQRALSYNPPPVIDLNQVVENAANKLKNWVEDLKYNSQQDPLNNYLEDPVGQQALNYYQDFPSLESPNIQQNNNQNSIIHEELAQKTKEISSLQIEDKRNKERISKLEKEIDELKKNKPLLKWWKRATEDSKEERII